MNSPEAPDDQPQLPKRKKVKVIRSSRNPQLYPSPVPKRPIVTAKKAPLKIKKKAIPVSPRIGVSDFSQNVVKDSNRREIRMKAQSSILQRFFFDASVATVALTFTILTLIKL